MKKLLSVGLSLFMLLGSLVTVSSAALNLNQHLDYDDTFTLGDLDGDGKVDLKDSSLMKSYILGRTDIEEKVITDAADLAADSVINSKDSFYLKALLVGDITSDELGDNHQVAKLTIGGVDISNFTIYAPEPEGSNNNATYAAELARKYIRVATGVDLQITTGEPTGNAIVFNSVPRASEFGDELGEEGYTYKVKNGSLYVYGTYRGNMYAIYEILEDYLGFRFYDSTHTFVYKKRAVDIPEGFEREIFIPALKFRYCGYVCEDDPQIWYFPSRMNGTQIYSWDEERYGTEYGPQFLNAHSFDYYWEMKNGDWPDDDSLTLAQKYDYKVKNGLEKLKIKVNAKDPNLVWQPCMSTTSSFNELIDGMLETVNMLENAWHSPGYSFTTTIKEYVDYGQKSISFSICDNGNNCTCSKCRGKAAKEGYSGLYIDAANRAMKALREYDGGKYANLRVHTILYNHQIPDTVRPDEGLIVIYCGQGCNNHHLGTEDCGNCFGQYGSNNIESNTSIKTWSKICEESGAEMWFWEYAVMYHYVLVGMPNILNLYYDIQFLYNDAGVKGIYYESGGRDYNFRNLKQYLAMKMLWEPTMSFDKYCDHLKEYLYMYYGDGYEQIFKYIQMQDECAKQCGTCFISNFDRPGDMYSPSYMRAHYDEMRTLLAKALELAEKPEHIERVSTLLYLFDFLGLSYVYHDWYTNGTEETRALYEQRYTDMWNYISAGDFDMFDAENVYYFPEEINFDICPILQVYGQVDKHGNISSDASRRAAINEFFINGTEPGI